MKNIYVSSQNFGFGPTSNLFSILKILKSKSDHFKIFALKNESMELFDKKNYGVIDYLVDYIDYKNVDLVFSSFDPHVILDAWLYDIPNVFYCNLFWYWNVQHKLKKLNQYKKQLEKYKKNEEYILAKEYFLKIFKNNSHEGIFMGYILSSKCFTRKFPNIEHYIKAHLNKLNISVFDIYISYNLSIKSIKIKNEIIFQLSGGRNPVVSMEENIIYASLCIKIMKHLSKTFDQLKFIFCINPFILEKIDIAPCNLSDNVQIISSVSQNENLAMMERALAIFTSPGLETIYEAIYTNCPVFLLPEQNAGQYSIFTMLSSSGYSPMRYLINEVFPNRCKLPSEDDVHEIYHIIKNRILPCEDNMDLLFNKSKNFISLMMDKISRKKYVDMSLNSIKINKKDNPFTTYDPISDWIIQQCSS